MGFLAAPFFAPFFFLSLFLAAPLSADFLCTASPPAPRLAQSEGRLSALVVFAKFRGEAPGDESAPPWAADLFNRRREGSFAHFYEQMSRGRLRVEGQVLPRRYASRSAAPTYVAEKPGTQGKFGLFNREILEQADRDADFGLFDSDGPDGVPNSGDDDGYVDVVFINLLTVPRDFFIGGATGLASLGLDADYISDDPAAAGGFVRVRSRFSGFGGTTQRGHTFSVTASTMCHEFGHVLGLPDLFDQSSVTANGELDPEEDSAGIGKWGLMGLGTLGWGVEDGPNAFCAWSLARLGWVEVVEVGGAVQGLVLEEVMQSGKVYRIPLSQDEYFLLEHRRASGSYYNRNVPADGLLVWHVDERADNDEERHKQVDLVCADGLFVDRGFPGGLGDAAGGRDNLDFWSRDAAYAAAHNGNQGDATDPFDGVRFVRLAADTNPGLRAHAGFRRDISPGVALENIRRQGAAMVVDVVRREMPGHVRGDIVWAGGAVELDGDVVVEPGAKLTIGAGTTVRFAAGDSRQSGFDRDRGELLVYGELVLEGSAEAPISLRSAAPGVRWGGLFLLDGQDPAMEGVVVRDAVHGLVRFRLPGGQTRWQGAVEVRADLLVPPGAELVVAPGTVVRFGGQDLGRRGVSPAFAELVVEGALRVEGNAANPVQMTLDPLESETIWYGVRLGPRAQVEARFLRLDKAGFGFSGEVGEGRVLRLGDVEVRDTAGGGLRLMLNGRAEVDRTALTRNAGAGIRAEGSGRLVLRNVRVEGNGQEGIFLGNAALEAISIKVENNGLLDAEDPRSGLRAVGGRGQKIEVWDSELSNNTRHGVDAQEWEGVVELHRTQVARNRGEGLRAGALERLVFEDVGVARNLGGGAQVGGARVELWTTDFADNIRAGLVLEAGTSGAIEMSHFRNNSTGLELRGVEQLQVRTSTFENMAFGLVSDDASPVLHGNAFANNGTALQVRGGRVPARIEGNTFAQNRTALENLSAQTLDARGNYWGTDDSTAIARLIEGQVQWTPFLGEEPGSTQVVGEEGLPKAPALYAGYPNPFNAQVVLPFALARGGRAELVVYDALGRTLRVLAAGEWGAGWHRVVWDGRDGEGRDAGSGVYFYRLRAGDFAAVGRVVLVR